MSSEAAVAVFTFWTAFFTAVSFKGLLGTKRDRVINRLGKLSRLEKVGAGKLQVAEIVEEQSRVHQGLRGKLIKAGLKRRSDLEKFLLFQRICYTTPLITLAASFFFFTDFFTNGCNRRVCDGRHLCFNSAPLASSGYFQKAKGNQTLSSGHAGFVCGRFGSRFVL